MKKLIITLNLIFVLGINAFAQYADTINYTFRIGSAFDFLNSNLTFNKVYGEVKYCKNNLIYLISPAQEDSIHFGFELGGYTGNSLTQIQKNYRTYYEEIDLSYKSKDSISIIKKNSSFNLKNGYQQFSLNAAPYIAFTFGHHFKIGLGVRAELFRFTNYTKLTDEVIIRTDTLKVYSPIESVHRLRGIRDSIGNTINDGYFGLFVPISIFSKHVNIRLNSTIGFINSTGQNQIYQGASLYAKENNKFFLIETTITNPKSGISVHANIRGLFPNQIPIYNVFVSKSFNIDKIYEAVTGG